MRIVMIVAAALPLFATGGCVRTVASVATAPFRAAGQAADWATTSQDEADRNYGRKMRRKEAREGRERRDYARECRKHPDRCDGYQGYQAANDE